MTNKKLTDYISQDDKYLGRFETRIFCIADSQVIIKSFLFKKDIHAVMDKIINYLKLTFRFPLNSDKYSKYVHEQIKLINALFSKLEKEKTFISLNDVIKNPIFEDLFQHISFSYGVIEEL